MNRIVDVIGYEGIYEIEENVGIWALNYGLSGKRKVRKPTLDQNGYYVLSLSKNNVEDISPLFINSF